MTVFNRNPDVVGCRRMSSDVVGCSRVSSGVAGRRWVSSDVVGRRWASLGVAGCRWVSSGVVGRRWVSSDVVGCRWASPVITAGHRCSSPVIAMCPQVRSKQVHFSSYPHYFAKFTSTSPLETVIFKLFCDSMLLFIDASLPIRSSPNFILPKVTFMSYE